jgi:heme exporter protein D
MDLGPHAEFIIWAYAGVALLVAGLILAVAWDARRVAARLKALEDKGIRRRSAGSAS